MAASEGVMRRGRRTKYYYEDISLEMIEALHSKMDEIFLSLQRLERSVLSQLDDWIAETRRAREKFQAEFFPEKTVAM